MAGRRRMHSKADCLSGYRCDIPAPPHQSPSKAPETPSGNQDGDDSLEQQWIKTAVRSMQNPAGCPVPVPSNLCFLPKAAWFPVAVFTQNKEETFSVCICCSNKSRAVYRDCYCYASFQVAESCHRRQPAVSTYGWNKPITLKVSGMGRSCSSPPAHPLLLPAAEEFPRMTLPPWVQTHCTEEGQF